MPVCSFAGWWGHDPETRFDMPPDFDPIPGAQGFQQSNPSILALAALQGSLEIFKSVGMPAVRERSIRLTGYLETLLVQSPYFVPVEHVEARYGEDGKHANAGKPKIGFTIITPRETGSRGAQLSLLMLPQLSGVMEKVFAVLQNYGVIGDERQPDVLRLSPTPLYNTPDDCKRAAAYLNLAIESLSQ